MTFPPDDNRLDHLLQFADAHQAGDPQKLALMAHKYPDVDMPFVIDQIVGRRIASSKLPQWAATQGIVYPPRVSMEQCSSEQAALYKASLVAGDSLIDLTGGLGVDFSYMARRVEHATYVERQELLCRIAEHNFPLLGVQADVVQADAALFLHEHINRPAGTIFLDPARRDNQGNRVMLLQDCSPDVTTLLPALLAKAQRIIIKLAPMLDVTLALRQLQHVSQVHIVSIDGQCRELLLVLEPTAHGEPVFYCVNNHHCFTYYPALPAPEPSYWDGDTTGTLYLHEPNASVMKAACHKHVAHRFGISMMAPDSHLFVSRKPVEDFPGRSFVVDTVTTMNRRALTQALRGIDRANVSTRNFPMRAPELARRLGMKDGGNTFIFGTTSADATHLIFITHKL